MRLWLLQLHGVSLIHICNYYLIQLRFQSFVAVYAQNSKSAVLQCLSQSEECCPQNTFCSYGNGEDCLCKRCDIAQHTHGKNDDSGAERQLLKPCYKAFQ